MFYLMIILCMSLFDYLQDGYTPLHHAARNGRTDVCVLLIEKGANMEAQDKVRVNYTRTE